MRWATAWVPIAVIALLLTGFSDIVPVSFSGSGVALAQLACPEGPPCGVMGNESIPSGVSFTVHWKDLSGGTAAYWVGATSLPPIGPNGTTWVVCSGYGPSFSCQLTSVGGVYAFGSITFVGEPNQSVSYTGSYYTSLL